MAAGVLLRVKKGLHIQIRKMAECMQNATATASIGPPIHLLLVAASVCYGTTVVLPVHRRKAAAYMYGTMSRASRAGVAAPVATCSGDSPPHGLGAGGAGTEPRRSPPRIPRSRSNRPFHADPAMASAGPSPSATIHANSSSLKSSPRSHRRIRRSAGGSTSLCNHTAVPTAAKAHPFTDNSNRTNFPGFDAALFGSAAGTGTRNAAASSSSSSDSPPRSDANVNTNTTSSSADADTSSQANDNSPSRDTDASFASSNNLNNFSLDLSIGARAALAEHRRHVARYGIDGDAAEVQRPPVDTVHHPGTPHSGGDTDRSSLSTLRGSPGEGGTNNNSSGGGGGSGGSGISKTNSSPNKHRPPRDDWEHYNDGSTHVSFASTFIVHGGDIDDNVDDSNELHNASNVMLGRSFLSDASHDRAAKERKGGCGHEAATDDDNSSSADNSSPNRSDYFNSSRVHLLATPEKNKPIVDEASRRTRELAHEDGAGTFARHHVTGRGNAHDDDDVGFDDTVSSFIGVDDSTVGGSTVVGDVSGGMAYLFREAMRLNASAAGTDVDDAQIDIPAGLDMEYIDNDEIVDRHPSKSFGSKGESFVECEGGIEFVADISDILSAVHSSSTQTPPSRKSEESAGKSSGSGSGSGNISQKLSADSFSTPRRGSPRRRLRQASPKYSSPSKPFGRDKENAEDFNIIALSPIASKAGAEAAKLLSAGSFRYAYGSAGGGVAKGGTPPRTPLREFGSPRKHTVGATGSARMARNGGLAPTPERGESTMSSFLNDMNLSVSMIESNDQSLLSTHGISPLRGGSKEDDETTPERLLRSNSFDSPGATERRRRRNDTSSEGKVRSRSVDSPGRRVPRRVVKSLGARYSQPDRFEDNFSPVSATQESTELNSVSRSLLQSFEA